MTPAPVARLATFHQKEAARHSDGARLRAGDSRSPWASRTDRAWSAERAKHLQALSARDYAQARQLLGILE